MNDHTWKPSDSQPPQIQGWDEAGNLIGYTLHNGIVTFDKPPYAILWNAEIVDNEVTQDE